MKAQLEHILQSLFHKPSLEEVEVDELEQMVKEHPYFSTGQFLLAQKLRDSGNAEQQSQRAALYFHNPLWLHWQLKQFSNGKSVELPVQQHAAAIPVETPGYDTVEEVVAEEEEQLLTWDQPVEEQRVAEPEEQVAEPITDKAPVFHEEPAEEQESLEYEAPVVEEQPVEYKEPIVEEPVKHEDPFVEERVEHEEPIKEEHTEYQEDEALAPEEELAAETIGPVEEAIPAEPDQDEPVAGPEQVEYSGPADEMHSFHEPEVSPAPSAPSDPVIQKEEAAPLVFEAYYTIDYFASQGIKAPAEVQPGDKLGRQLKSFTEWLKTMKRLPQAQVETVTDESEQQHIRQVAANSLEQKEVVTETMAEVLVKQGKNPEAIAIYEKLSLLDPSKSAYFAAKIENLKVN